MRRKNMCFPLVAILAACLAIIGTGYGQDLADMTPLYVVETGGVHLVTRSQPSETDAVPVGAIPPASRVLLLTSTRDQSWLLAAYAGSAGWIQRRELISPDLPQDCISIVGDSMPYGTVVFEVPGHGFPVVRTRPLAVVLDELLDASGMTHLEIRDRSVAASYLSPLGTLPYAQTPEYSLLLHDTCRFVVVTPWINDLTLVSRADSAGDHINELAGFLTAVRASSRRSQIIVMGYYFGAPASFVPGYGEGVTVENITRFNEMLFAACAEGGLLAEIGDVTCMETAGLFAGMGETHVVTARTQAELEAIVYEPLMPPESDFFAIFWRENPGATVRGDGMHLSETGKLILVEALYSLMRQLNPALGRPSRVPVLTDILGQ